MDEPIGMTDPETALRREKEVLAQRFPDVAPDEIEQRVRDTYDSLKSDATVESHLIAVTEGKVTEDLRADGAEVHVREKPEES